MATPASYRWHPDLWIQMTLDYAYEARCSHTAFRINAQLPEERREMIYAEATRVVRDVLLPRKLRDRRILLVGGSGYVGLVLTDHLLRCGYQVYCLDLLLYSNGMPLVTFLSDPNYTFIHADMGDQDAMAAALSDVTDLVLLAGLVGDPITKKYPEAAAQINDEAYAGVLNLLNGRGLNKVLFVSTCSNYGLIEGNQLADEDFPLKPLSLYANSKVRVEQALAENVGAADYAHTILRFATAFGLSPRMRFDLTISEFTRQMYLGDELLVYDPDTWRPYCHVRDFAEIIRRVLEAPLDLVAGQVFNAGGDANNFTKRMLIEAIRKFTPNASIRFQEHGSDPRNYRVDFSKIRERLLFEPEWQVEGGVRELIKAMDFGLFKDISQPHKFYGNWDLDYPVAS